jgi:ribosomal protein L11 methyltransferase
MVKPEGSLLLSGILSEQANEVMAAYAPWFTFTDPVTQDDWTRLEGKRKS